MTINISICDDSWEASSMIRSMVAASSKSLKFKPDFFVYEDGNILLNEIFSGEAVPDILFLDINMPAINGLEVAGKLRKEYNDIILIFVSGHDQYVFNALEYNPFSYIRKNRLKQEFPDTFKKAYAKVLEKINTYIAVKTADGIERVNPKEIMYIKTAERRIAIHTVHKKIIYTRSSIKELYDSLDDKNFIFIYSGCVVNLLYVIRFSQSKIILEDNTVLDVSRRRTKELKETVEKYWQNS